jgi:hypothetical protein
LNPILSSIAATAALIASFDGPLIKTLREESLALQNPMETRTGGEEGKNAREPHLGKTISTLQSVSICFFVAACLPRIEAKQPLGMFSVKTREPF